MTSAVWQTSRFKIDLAQPKVMGIVNLTPDSFSDGGRHDSLKKSLDYAQKALAQGADILDIGGESSRPGAEAVDVQEELSRILPFLKEAVTWNVPISVDTLKPESHERLPWTWALTSSMTSGHCANLAHCKWWRNTQAAVFVSCTCTVNPSPCQSNPCRVTQCNKLKAFLTAETSSGSVRRYWC